MTLKSQDCMSASQRADGALGKISVIVTMLGSSPAMNSCKSSSPVLYNQIMYSGTADKPCFFVHFAL